MVGVMKMELLVDNEIDGGGEASLYQSQLLARPKQSMKSGSDVMNCAKPDWNAINAKCCVP